MLHIFHIYICISFFIIFSLFHLIILFHFKEIFSLKSLKMAFLEAVAAFAGASRWRSAVALAGDVVGLTSALSGLGGMEGL